MSSQTGIPQHVAIIMDGNGRWAKRRRRDRVNGHIRGSRRVKPIVKEAQKLGVKALTLFAFSTENWSRPQAELDVLWKLMKKFLIREADELDENNVRIRFIGEMDRIPADVREVADSLTDRLKNNSGLQLTLAVSYGGQREIIEATRRLAGECANGELTPDQIDENRLRDALWTGDMGELSNVDLLIRTSGEFRISNFLLWQLAYAEFCFTNIAWPDFEVQHFRQAVADFGHRERRFGNVGAGLTRDPKKNSERSNIFATQESSL